MDYTVLTNSDLLILARDRLRAVESDYYRISLTHEPNKEARLQALEAEHEELKAEVARLEQVVQQEADPAEPVSESSQLQSRTKDELLEVAKQRGVEVKASDKKADILKALESADGQA